LIDGSWALWDIGAVATALSSNTKQENEKLEAAAPSGARAFWWIATVTLTGAIVMAMELTAFRLCAPGRMLEKGVRK